MADICVCACICHFCENAPHACSLHKEMEEPLEKIQKAGYTAAAKGNTNEWKGYALSATL